MMADCEANLIEAFRIVARARAVGRLEEERGVVRIASGIPSATMNPVFVSEIPRNPTKTIARSKEFMDAAGVSRWSVVAFERAADVLASLPEAEGLTLRKILPGMVLGPIPSRTPPRPTGLTIRRATTPALWTQMILTGVEGLSGKAPKDASDWPFELSRVVRGYVGFVKGVPVATSFGVAHRGVCGVFFVATLPPYRRRGIGAALTWQAIADGRRDGCRVAYLQATEMGLPVYSGMGFRKVTQYVTWQSA
jgi:N-acetylglutamate synthase